MYENVCSVEYLEMADRIARRGKANRKDIIAFDEDRPGNIQALHEALVNKTFRTSAYTTFPVWEPKERIVYWLPYIDQVVHHSAMLELGPLLTAMFTKDTYSCIKGRGIHAASFALRDALKDIPGTQYCLKLDIQKFYPSVDHDVLKALLRRKIKDKDFLELLDEIIESASGLPIGNYLSIAFGNFYLAYFDHWIKEVLKVKYYFRYTDDIVILADNKPYLHQLLAKLREYLQQELKLTIKGNYQVFPVEARGIDFVGYPTFHKYVLLRKSIKKSFARMMARNYSRQSFMSYMGWLKYCNSLNLQLKLSHEKIQRPGHAIKVVRRQNRNERHPGQRNGRDRLPDRPEQTGYWQTMPDPSN